MADEGTAGYVNKSGNKCCRECVTSAAVINLRVRPRTIGRRYKRGNCVTFFDLRQYGLHFSAYFVSHMKRAYKYRFYPTPWQVELLAQTFGCVRFVYNSILRWRTDAYYKRQEKIGYTQASARLTALKRSRNLPSSMMFPACRYSKPCATNRPDSQTFSPDEPDIRHSKASAINRLLRSPMPRLNTAMAGCTWQRAKRL